MAIRSVRGEELFGTLYAKGDVVFREGDVGNALFVIQSGAVEVSREHGGRRMVVALLERGDFFGEMALVDDEKRSATVTAIADSRLLPITRRSFRERVRADPGVALHLLRTLCLRMERMRATEAIEARSLGGRIAGPTFPLDLGREDLVTVGAGDVVFRKGEPGDSMFVIAEGVLEVLRDDEDGRARVVARLGARDLVGETALLTGRPRTATVVAAATSKLLPVRRSEFLERIRAEPEIALHAIQVMVLRLRAMLGASSRAGAARSARRRFPVVAGPDRPLRTAIVALSSCGGCAAVLLEDPSAFLGGLEVVYCPMLMDERSFPHVDLAIVDGAVRAREDIERLEEARAKSRWLVGWGTCAATGGVPASANRFELEDVVAESFGRTQDLFGHYFAGAQAVDGPAFLVEELSLLRRAFGIGAVVRVDGYIPGCPPPFAPLTQVLAELQGRTVSAAARERKPVCSECPRTARKEPVEHFRDFPGGDIDPTACLASRGVLCLGFMARCGCGAPCPKGGLPCWGCRGATEPALRKMADGDTVEGISLEGLTRFSRLEAEKIRPALMRSRTCGLGALGLGAPLAGHRTRIR